MNRRRVCVVTTTRADYSYLRPVMLRLMQASDVELQVVVSGTHLSSSYGMTVGELEADNLPIAERVEMETRGLDPLSIAQDTGQAVTGFARAFARLQPDILVLLGDRYETLGAAMAILPFVWPIAHIAGGETTMGAIDDGIRHALTKLSHLHFVATDEYARRIQQLSEEPWRIHVSGAPTLDNIRAVPDLSDAEVEAVIGMSPTRDFLLATFHPVTLEASDQTRQIREFLGALEASGSPVVVTYPNADAYASEIINAMRGFADAKPEARSLVESLGTRGYFALMRRAAAMVGNSSSGIIEAASFGLPVVNVGERQRGRMHGANVISVPCELDAITDGIRAALSPQMRGAARSTANPYGDGQAAERIVAVLRSVPLDSKLLKKRFQGS
jgi:UDP-hydrolysing UDP-N-acetyl-D-glucosamine 2-epimerase